MVQVEKPIKTIIKAEKNHSSALGFGIKIQTSPIITQRKKWKI